MTRIDSRHAAMRKFYADLFEEHQLSAAAIERFMELLDRPNPAELRKLLGPAGYDMYENYTRDISMRWRLNKLRDRLARTSTPLRPEQRAELMEIMRQERREKYRRLAAATRVIGLGAPGARAKLDSELAYEKRVRERAATVLTPAQLSRFIKTRRLEFAMMRLSTLFRK